MATRQAGPGGGVRAPVNSGCSVCSHCLIPGRHEVILAACLLKKCEILSLTFSIILLKGFMASCFRKKIVFQYLLVAGAELAHLFRMSSAHLPALLLLHRRCLLLCGTSKPFQPAFSWHSRVWDREKTKFALREASNNCRALDRLLVLQLSQTCNRHVTPNSHDLCDLEALAGVRSHSHWSLQNQESPTYLKGLPHV